jgi:PDZ domain-containing secreted protein
LTFAVSCGIINTEIKKGIKKMKTYVAKKDLGEGYKVEYRVKAENKEEAQKKISEISGEQKITVKEL